MFICLVYLSLHPLLVSTYGETTFHPLGRLKSAQYYTEQHYAEQGRAKQLSGGHQGVGYDGQGGRRKE